ncbi:MAG: zinc-ribbon domain-containing protein [Comamonadaceae bacterium]|nr:zinc-ribbon domain-containing protein [Comamonadaceae bacterium]
MLATQADEVREAYRPYLRLEVAAELDGWVLAGRKAAVILSRCPNCDTVFRVTPEQLTARQGMVRCGRCGTAFSALGALVDTAAGTRRPSCRRR